MEAEDDPSAKRQRVEAEPPKAEPPKNDTATIVDLIAQREKVRRPPIRHRVIQRHRRAPPRIGASPTTYGRR